MKVKIRASGVRFTLPVPLCMVRLAIGLTPSKAFEQAAASIPEPYRSFATKKAVRRIAGECLDVLKENKGLEVVRVEARDHTFVSIRL